MTIQNNKNRLTEILNKINNLPDAGSDGVVLPMLSNPASVEQIVDGYEAIDAGGNKITGTNPYEKTTTDNAVNTQASGLADIESLLAQALTLLDGKAAGSGSGDGGYKVAIGTYEPASDEYMWGVDLDFTPTFVAVLGIADGTKIINPSGTGGVEEFTLLECEGTFNGQSYSYHAGLSPKSSTSVQYDIDDDFSEIYIDENRFDVLPGVAFFPLSKYLYIAIGESESGDSSGSAVETKNVFVQLLSNNYGENFSATIYWNSFDNAGNIIANKTVINDMRYEGEFTVPKGSLMVFHTNPVLSQGDGLYVEPEKIKGEDIPVREFEGIFNDGADYFLILKCDCNIYVQTW